MGAVILFREVAGFPGSITRVPNSIVEPCLIDASAPPLLYGVPVIMDQTTNGVRPFVATDTSAQLLYGILVRPFPTSQFSATNYGSTPLGTPGVPPVSGPCDVLVSGYINVQVPVGSPNPTTAGGTTVANEVYIWIAATSGVHIQGGFETVASGGNTLLVTSAANGVTTHYKGPQDANGVIELAFNV